MRLSAGSDGHLDDVAVDVELPAVIEAAQPAFLVAREDAARRAGAGSIRRARRAGPCVSRNTTRSSPSRRTLTGAPSGSATSSDRQAAIQWRRMIWPIGASPSTRHSRSFSSGVIGASPRRGAFANASRVILDI